MLRNTRTLVRRNSNLTTARPCVFCRLGRPQPPSTLSPPITTSAFSTSASSLSSSSRNIHSTSSAPLNASEPATDSKPTDPFANVRPDGSVSVGSGIDLKLPDTPSARIHALLNKASLQPPTPPNIRPPPPSFITRGGQPQNPHVPIHAQPDEAITSRLRTLNPNQHPTLSTPRAFSFPTPPPPPPRPDLTPQNYAQIREREEAKLAAASAPPPDDAATKKRALARQLAARTFPTSGIQWADMPEEMFVKITGKSSEAFFIAEARKLAAAGKLPGGSSAPPQRLPPNFVSPSPGQFRTPVPLRMKREEGRVERPPSGQTPEGMLRGVFGRVPEVKEMDQQAQAVGLGLGETQERRGESKVVNREELMAALGRQAPVQMPREQSHTPRSFAPSAPSAIRQAAPVPPAPQPVRAAPPPSAAPQPVRDVPPPPAAPQLVRAAPVPPVAPQPVQAAPRPPQPAFSRPTPPGAPVAPRGPAGPSIGAAPKASAPPSGPTTAAPKAPSAPSMAAPRAPTLPTGPPRPPVAPGFQARSAPPSALASAPVQPVSAPVQQASPQPTVSAKTETSLDDDYLSAAAPSTPRPTLSPAELQKQRLQALFGRPAPAPSSAPAPPSGGPRISTTPRAPVTGPPSGPPTPLSAHTTDLFDDGSRQSVQPRSFNRIQMSDPSPRRNRFSINDPTDVRSGLDALLGGERPQQKEPVQEKKRYTLPNLARAPAGWNVEDWSEGNKAVVPDMNGSLDELIGGSRARPEGRGSFGGGRDFQREGRDRTQNGGETFVYDPNAPKPAPRAAPYGREGGYRSGSYREGGAREGGYQSRDTREPRRYGRDTAEPSKKAREEEAGAHAVTFSDMNLDRSEGRRKKGGKATKNKSQWAVDEDDMEAEMAAMTEKEEKRRAKERKRRERERNTVPPIYLPEFITVEHLATMLKVPVERFMGQIRNMGFEGVAYDQVLNSEDAGLIAAEYGFEPIVDRDTGKDLLPRPDVTPEERAALPPRPPVVTIMGHVDHGKTTLLDYLRKSAVAEGEHGGITQHIGAFSVKLESGKTITFLDTPGHAAFLSMRERGATVTDIVILVVAADDSVMPQTIEAIKHAKAANVPIIVAVNKCDKPDADPERVKLDLARHNVEIEDFGGDVPVVLVSGKTGLGMAEMEETIMAVSEVLDMRAEETGQAEGWVLEASTKKRGRVATVLVRRGTLRVGDILVAGTTWAKVRTLQDHAGNTLESAGPGQPVEVDGWRENPEAGALAIQAADEGRAREAVDYRLEKIERVKAMEDMEVVNEQRRLQKIAREKEVELEREKKFRDRQTGSRYIAAESIFDDLDLEAEGAKEKKGVKVLPLIIKADVQGSVEAVINQVAALGNDLVQTKIIRGAAGAVSEFDVDHAEAADGYIITFNSTPSPDITNYARKKGVTIISSTIIYRLVDDLKLLLESHLPPIITERTTCTVEIAQIIPVNAGGKKGVPIAGCRVTNGTLMRNGLFRVFRGATGPNGEGGEKVWEGRLSSLRHFKKDVESMKKGGECGVGFEGLKNFEVGDLVVGYEVVEEKRKL